jgi:hypothetical protein
VSKAKVETTVATTLGVIAGLGMLFCASDAWIYDAWLNSPWGDDGLPHEEIVEVLPFFFWFAVWFGLLLGRRGAARVICNGRSLCWAAAGAILGRVAFQMTVGDLPTPDRYRASVCPPSIGAAAAVITWLCIFVGAAAGAAMAWLLPLQRLPTGGQHKELP